jgi:hypothetical protein
MKQTIQKILSFSNRKIEKSIKAGILSAIIHFSPAKLSGFNVCPNATAGCIRPCLNTSGDGRRDSVQTARIKKTRRYFENRPEFMQQLQKEIDSLIRKAKKNGLIPALRPNGTSDLIELGIETARNNPDLQVYDYTKNFDSLLRADLPANYDLTFSRSEKNWPECLKALNLGFRVAAVVDPAISDGELRKLLKLRADVQIIDGDDDDATFKKPGRAVLRLKPKGRAVWDFSGFVIWHPATVQKKIKLLKAKLAKDSADAETRRRALQASIYLTLPQN